MTDTIYARATSPGRAAIAVVRISGPQTAEIFASIAGDLPTPRTAAIRRLRDGSGEVIDEALVLWMPAPASFTGEDCAELHIHGGPAVFEALASELQRQHARLAEPGEFSRRAFLNGKMDLLEAEAIADLVDAETASQRRQALAQMSGEVGRRYETWRDSLLHALAFIEAENDFPDEDLPGALAERGRPLLSRVLRDLEAAKAIADRGLRVREGYRIALIGAPNAGKSSLLNKLVGEDAAIVSRHAGTTRDVIAVPVVIEGFSVILGDTAGLRQTTDEVEQEGVARARNWAATAAWRLFLFDPADDLPDVDAFSALAQTGDLLVATKADQQNVAPSPSILLDLAQEHGLDVTQSSVRGSDGLADVWSRLRRRLIVDLGGAEAPATTRLRHQQAISAAIEALDRGSLALAASPERSAEDIRAAIRALQSVIGDADREAVLDRVFAGFCIGK